MATMRRSSRTWELTIDQQYLDATSSLPTRDPRWRGKDSNGHEHYYDKGKYPTLEFIIDASHWCDGSEGLGPHDPHEAIDESHYECLICRETVKPGVIAPYTPQSIPGMRTATLTGIRTDGSKVTAILEEHEVELIRSKPDISDARIAVLLDRIEDERIISSVVSSR